MKRKVVKISVTVIVILMSLVVIGLAYLKLALPNVGEAPKMTIEITPEKIEHGRYLANHVMVCLDCHSQRDWSKFSGPMILNTEGMGGEIFDQKFGFPGRYISSNITPYNLASWSDGEIFRALTSGVSKNGKALFPVMPYHSFGRLDREDIEAVIAYIRTLKPVQSNPEVSASDFPMNFIINTIPVKATLAARPNSDNLVEYGKYMVTAAACFDCHTRQVQGKFVGEPFAGGMEFPLADGSLVRSTNITPHQTGIGAWDENQFIQRFKAFADSNYVAPTVKAGEFQTLMPWTMYAKMKESDLKAIFAYLRTLTPVDNTVERFVSSDKRMLSEN